MSYPLPARPVPLDRSALAWWLALSCWFTGSAVGQLTHDGAALSYSYRYGPIQAGPLTVVLFGLAAVFLASVVLPMRDGERWSRLTLTAVALPMAFVLVWQVAHTLVGGPATGPELAQGTLCVIALGALAGAVDLMYLPAARTYYRQRGDHVR
jgi:hypothetical protein